MNESVYKILLADSFEILTRFYAF